MAIKAFTYDLGTKPTQDSSVISEANKDQDPNIVQQTPSWMVVFVPFAIRDTKNLLRGSRGDLATKSRDPFIVVNDCTQLRVMHSKASPFGSMQGTFRSGDINYLTTIVPGDYIFAWMNSNETTLAEQEAKVRAKEAANDFHSGLKFVGRVETVREKLVVNPATGIKQLTYDISAFSFQEFNTKLYQVFFDISPALIFNELNKKWADILEKLREKPDIVQDLVRLLVNVTLGSGPGNPITDPIVLTPNDQFIIPGMVGKLLNRTKTELGGRGIKYTDVCTLLFGIQQYSSNVSSKINNLSGFLPSNLNVPVIDSEKPPNKIQYETSKKCTGGNVTFATKWNDSPIWAVLSQYTNLVINELYTCMRVDRDGRIAPTLIMRQIPFTTQQFKGAGGEAVTLFSSLPRWKPHPAQVLNHDIGRSNSLRVNFVQVWGDTSLHALQAQKTVVDVNDIKRSGLRTMIPTSNLDFPSGSKLTRAPSWTKIVSDWAINGHLKLNGTIQMVGITEPICIGDNFEWNGNVFHIEQVVHACQLAPTGQRTFRTTVMLSNGLEANTDELPGMKNEFREELEKNDTEGIYPGYSDIQDIPGREKGEHKGDRTSVNLRGENSLSSKQVKKD